MDTAFRPEAAMLCRKILLPENIGGLAFSVKDYAIPVGENTFLTQEAKFIGC